RSFAQAREQRLRSRVGAPELLPAESPPATSLHRALEPHPWPPASAMDFRRQRRRRSKSRPATFDSPPRQDSLHTSTSRLRPRLPAAPPAAESAVGRSWAVRAQKKNPSRRKIFPAASPGPADSGWADSG